MTTAINELDKAIPKKKSLFRRSRFLGLLSLAFAFLCGYMYAKSMTRSTSATLATVQNQPTQHSTFLSDSPNPASEYSMPEQVTHISWVTSTPIDNQNDSAPTVATASGIDGTPPPAQAENCPLAVASIEQVPINSFGSAQSNTIGTCCAPNFAPAYSAPSYVPAPAYSVVSPATAQPFVYQSPEEEASNQAIVELQAKLQQAKHDEKSEFVAKLKTEVSNLFKLRHAAQAKEIDELEKQLVEAKALHTKRQEKQDEIIERRLSNLMNEVDDLDWDRSLTSAVAHPIYVTPSTSY